MNDLIEIKKTGASLARGKSKQNYGTPRAFIATVEKRFGPLAWDLAATPENAKAPRFFTEADDSLKQDWLSLEGNLWLNPPFADIAPWAKKASECARRVGFLFLLTPASIGTEWFARHCHGSGYVLGLSPRLTFEGTSDPYPKDLALTVWGSSFRGFDTWRWDDKESA